jgi:hypothetical protein
MTFARSIALAGTCLATVALVMPAGGVAAQGDPQSRHTPAGSARARSTLLASSSFGTGWTAAPATASPNPVSCKAAPSNQSDLVQIGLAARSFTAGKDKQIVQAVRVYKTAAQAARAWERTVTVGLLVCDEQRLEQSNMHIKVTGQLRLPVAHVAPRTAAFRITAVSRSEDGKTITSRLYLDLLLVGRGNAISSVVFSAAGSPFAQSFEGTVARTVAQRLGAQLTA